MSRAWGKQFVRSAILERDVEKQIRDFLEWRGWKVIKTDVFRVKAGPRYISSGEIGQADTICVRNGSKPGNGDVFFAELKRPGAKTSKERKENQEQWQTDMVRRGFACYRCPDNHPDPFTHFELFYRELYPGDVR